MCYDVLNDVAICAPEFPHFQRIIPRKYHQKWPRNGDELRTHREWSFPFVIAAILTHVFPDGRSRSLFSTSLTSNKHFPLWTNQLRIGTTKIVYRSQPWRDRILFYSPDRKDPSRRYGALVSRKESYIFHVDFLCLAGNNRYERIIGSQLRDLECVSRARV